MRIRAIVSSFESFLSDTRGLFNSSIICVETRNSDKADIHTGSFYYFDHIAEFTSPWK